MSGALGVLATTLAMGLVLAATVSVAVSLAWPLLRSRIARWHAVDRGRILGALLAAPVVLPILALAIALAPGLLGLLLPALDHCHLHPEHPHLCLVHGTSALPTPVVFSLGAASFFAFTLGLRTLGGAIVQVRPLRALANQATHGLSPRVDQVVSGLPIACTYGLLQPRALVSTGLMDGLRPDQVAAVVAHEGEHARRRDPLRLLLTGLASCALWPGVRRAMLAELVLSAEQACDERAAHHVDDRVLVAETILAVERLLAGSRGATTPAAAGIEGGLIAVRVESLLAAPRRRGQYSLALAFGLGLLTLLAAPPLHHEMEHLLAWMLGLG